MNKLIIILSTLSIFTYSNMVFAETDTLAKIPANAKITYVENNVRASGSKIEIAEYTEDSVYQFSYPKVCDVKWNPAQVSFRCPNTYGFSKFEWWYGSGVTSALSGDNVKMDDQHGTYPADNEWHTFNVKRAPHAGQASWTKVRIIPLF